MEPKLLRALGPLDLTAIGINGVIGAGIFVLPATVVQLFLMLVNLLGVRYGAWLVNFFTVGKLLPLAIFMGVGVFSIQAKNLLPLTWPATHRFGEAALLLIFAYGGFEILTIPAEEVD